MSILDRTYFRNPLNVVVANPAAGANFSYVTTAPLRLEIVRFGLTTDATVINRSAVVRIFDPAANAIITFGTGFAHAASLAYSYEFSHHFNSITDNVALKVFTGIPDLIIAEGSTIDSSITNLQAADQITGISLHFEYPQSCN